MTFSSREICFASYIARPTGDISYTFWLFFGPPPYYGRSIPGPSPKTHAILLQVAVQGTDLIQIILCFLRVQTENPDIWSQFLSGELTVIELGNIFTHGTMLGKRRPGQCQVTGQQQQQEKWRPSIRVREIVLE